MHATALASDHRSFAHPNPRRVLWLAVAEARGHLMRATLAKELLAEVGIDVGIVTTSRAGADFVATFGQAAHVLPGNYRLVYDGQQNLARTRSRIVALRYLAAGCGRDLSEIAELGRSASVIVNDSFHPALLWSVLTTSELGRRVVHVHCENTRRAVEETGGRGPLGLLVRASMMRARRIEIVLGREHAEVPANDRFGEPDGGGTVRLPSLVAMPRPRAQVRAERGIAPTERFAVVYLNPFFHDPALAAAIEDALRGAGYRMHAVGEGFADRGWAPRDPRLADAVAAADLFVSAPGAGAVTMARTFGTPMIAIATDQPEQRQNLGSAGSAGSACTIVVAAADRARDQLRAAVARVPPATTPLDPALAIRRARALWLRTFQNLV